MKMKEIQLKSILKIFVLMFMFYSIYIFEVDLIGFNKIIKEFEFSIGILILIELIFLRKEK